LLRSRGGCRRVMRRCASRGVIWCSPSCCGNSILLVMLVFFFSSRRRHTRFKCDWSSDVCSSDLGLLRQRQAVVEVIEVLPVAVTEVRAEDQQTPPRLERLRRGAQHLQYRSEERRVGKECRSGWALDQEKTETRKQKTRAEKLREL